MFLLSLLAVLLTGGFNARGEAMLELFQVRWADLTAKMPEIAEAGYDSMWLPPPTKGSSVYSVGYDICDPFDLGDVNQFGTTATMYGTKAELLQMVETAHRFGIRVYFDNVMNHRAFTVPGYNANTPTNYYPGLIPRDFHLQTVGNYYANWPSVESWNNQWDVQYESLGGLIDLATEPGSINGNFGATLGSTTTKPIFVRQPTHPEYYMDTNLPVIDGGPWRPFNGTNGDPVAEDVNSYLIRSVIRELSETKCDGFRLDAVKHVPSGFFGDSTATFNGYCGAIQAMFDYVHGYGTNVIGNGYFESDDCRNSCFDSEAPRNDALLFGEHLGQPPSYSEYISSGMRLLNAPLRDFMNSALGGSTSLVGADGVAFSPNSGFDPRQSVMFAQSQDASGSYAAQRPLQNAYYFMHEGIADIYSDNYNKSTAPNYFPSIAYANYLGEYNDPSMPDIVYVHNQAARGGTRTRWSDQNIVAFERYDYRDVSGGNAYTNADATVALLVMNDKTSFPGDITFDDGVGQTYDGYYGGVAISNTKAQGLVVGFPPGSVLQQLSSSAPSQDRIYQKLLVHAATTSYSAAVASEANSDPAQRLIYVGSQTIPSGGGAIELNVPSASWVIYGYQWPEASRANVATNAIIFRQGGADAPRISVYRHDGINGDTNFCPAYPFKMRGSVDPYGNIVTNQNYSNLTYAIDVPIVTNAAFDVIARSDASAVNALFKLDGGIDLNSQMGLGPTTNIPGVAPTNVLDLRDNKPGYATDVYLGYEQAAFQFRNGPEKFGARLVSRDNIVSLGAETYYYTVGGTNTVVNGSGYGANTNTSTATWVYHDPAATNTAAGTNSTATQRMPFVPSASQSADIWVKVGYRTQTNTCFIYYTTDGTNPEGAYGVGKGTTKVVRASWATNDVSDTTIDWWKGTIPAGDNAAGAQIRYKVGLFNGGSYGFTSGNPTNWASIQPISDADTAKLFGLTQFGITNFNPTTATVWLHNDLNPANTVTGLKEGFHILRVRCFLPRTNKSAVYNTFLQTFYYDAAPPAAVFVNPPSNNYAISNATYQVIVRADSSATALEYNITDSDTNNDDAITSQNNGNGLTNGVAKFVSILPSTPTTSLNTAYSNYPVEFRFNYVAVPTNGSATITVHIKKATTTIFPGRVTALTNTVATVAPSQYVHISDPASDGMTLTLSSNDTYTINACFSSGLAGAGNIDYFSIFINGVFQPRRDVSSTPLYTIDPTDTSCGIGLKKISYDWTGAQPGTNVIQIIYTNNVILSDTRQFVVAAPVTLTPPDITSLANGNQLVVWSSISNYYYQVFATTNLLYPFVAISPVIPATGPSSYYFDSSPDPTNKFFRIELLP